MKLDAEQTKKVIVKFEGFSAVVLKNAVFWDVTPCGSCSVSIYSQRASVASYG
jgi:hypothetical protein